MAKSTETLTWQALDISALGTVADTYAKAQAAASKARNDLDKIIAEKLFGHTAVEQVNGAWRATKPTGKGARVMDSHEVVIAHKWGRASYATRIAGASGPAAPKGAVKL